jgi:ribonucleoside-diphosphate reductase alpha chain
VRDLKARKLWDPVMVNDLEVLTTVRYSRSTAFSRPKALYRHRLEVSSDGSSKRQPPPENGSDQAQSLTLYIAGARQKRVDVTYRMAWQCGLKSPPARLGGYQHREKSTVDTGKPMPSPRRLCWTCPGPKSLRH